MPERSRDMPNAIRFHKSGGPEVLVSEPVPIGKPGPGEARVRHTAVGVNFVDIYIRTGLYPAALPSGLGTEAAGVVEEVGPGVDHIKAGDRVAYAGGPLGAYSEMRVMPADRLVVLPQGFSDQQAAAMMLKAGGNFWKPQVGRYADPALLTARAVRRAHRIPPRQSPNPR